MCDVAYSRIVEQVFDAVEQSESVAAGMSRLLTFCECVAPERAALWNQLRARDFAGDARRVCFNFRDGLTSTPIPTTCSGFYFGLDALNMQRGKGIQFGCSTTYEEATDDGGVGWAFRLVHFPFQIHSTLLTELYGVVEMASLADYAVCVAYVGLAVRDMLRELPISVTLLPSKSRAVCWGPHDGDLYRLGTLRPDGLEVDCRLPLKKSLGKSREENPPCPYCGKALRAKQAKQCFECGANWRSAVN
jgi:hypothetical protein